MRYFTFNDNKKTVIRMKGIISINIENPSDSSFYDFKNCDEFAIRINEKEDHFYLLRYLNKKSRDDDYEKIKEILLKL